MVWERSTIAFFMALSSWFGNWSQYSTRSPSNVVDWDVWTTIALAKIWEIFGLEDGWVVYKGCHRLLKDKKPCDLGKSSQWERLQGSALPRGPNFHDQSRHNYTPIAEGHWMFGFVVVINDVHIGMFVWTCCHAIAGHDRPMMVGAVWSQCTWHWCPQSSWGWPVDNVLSQNFTKGVPLSPKLQLSVVRRSM